MKRHGVDVVVVLLSCGCLGCPNLVLMADEGDDVCRIRDKDIHHRDKNGYIRLTTYPQGLLPIGLT